MRWPRFAFVAAVLVLAINAAPLLQLVKTGGDLYYRNGDAEPLYLQYDLSAQTQALSRFGQWPVTLLHEAGLSGGWINFVFDLSLPLAFLILVHLVGQALELGERASILLATLAGLGPLLTSGANPLVREMYSRALASGAIPWLALNDAAFLPLARTPEPQLSLVILAGATLIAVRRRSLLPAFISLPFLYTFLALPAAFILLTMLARLVIERLKVRVSETVRSGLGCVLGWITLSGCAALMLTIAVPTALREFLVETHAPMLSLSSGLALTAYAVLRRSIRPGLRGFALIACLAPLAAVNIQVLMGWLVSPVSVEIYGGGQSVAIVLGLGLAAPAQADRLGRAAKALIGFTLVLFFGLCAWQALLAWRTPVLDDGVRDALRRNASRVAASDGNIARLLSMVVPRQARTALDFGQTYPQADPDRSFPRYLDDRAAILADPRRSAAYAGLLLAIDRGYAHNNEDQAYMTSHRPKEYRTSVDVAREAARWPSRSHDLTFVTVRDGRIVLDP